MTLGLSVIGWAILFVAYLPVAALLAWVGARRGVRSAAFALTFLITAVPFAAAIGEAAYVERNWQALCATATTEVKRRVVVEGFYDDGTRRRNWENFNLLERDGFRFVEWKDAKGDFWRTDGFVKFSEGGVRSERVEKPIARYHWTNPSTSTPAGYRIARREESIVDSETGEVIARSILAFRWPSFVDGLWRRWFDSMPSRCGTYRDLVSETLIGIDKMESKR